MTIVVESYSADYQQDASDTTLSISVPAGTQDGDVLLALGIKLLNRTITPPAGWTQIYHDSSPRTCAWYKVASSESGSYTWTQSDAFGGFHLCILRLSGADSSTIDTAAAEESTATWNTIVGCPDVTISNNGSMVFRWGHKPDKNIAYSVTSTEGVEEYDVNGLTHAISLAIYSHAEQASGSYTAADLVLSTAINAKSGMTIAIAPAASAKYWMWARQHKSQVIGGGVS